MVYYGFNFESIIKCENNRSRIWLLYSLMMANFGQRKNHTNNNKSKLNKLYNIYGNSRIVTEFCKLRQNSF